MERRQMEGRTDGEVWRTEGRRVGLGYGGTAGRRDTWADGQMGINAWTGRRTDKWTDVRAGGTAAPVVHPLIKAMTGPVAPREGCEAVKSPLPGGGRGFQGPLVLTVRSIKQHINIPHSGQRLCEF